MRMGRPRGVLDIRPTALDTWSDFGGTMTREGGLREWRMALPFTGRGTSGESTDLLIEGKVYKLSLRNFELKVLGRGE